MNQEYYLSVHVPAAGSARDAIAILQEQLAKRLKGRSEPLLMRFFCSDVHAHAPLLEEIWPGNIHCQRVYIGQAPLDSAYISLQAYGCANVETSPMPGRSLLVRHGAYESLWTLDYPATAGDAESQSALVIASLEDKLDAQGMSAAGNLLRTWYYMRDVDNNYAGMIRARVAAYEATGLGPAQHFVASTGIEGASPDPHALVCLHARSVRGLKPEQITYLAALTHLCPTHDYGVNFERATRVAYGDRIHCHISGTASIDSKGNVLHVGDCPAQFGRAMENVGALLAEGGMDVADLKCATIYLRDPWDYPAIRPLAEQILPAGCAINFTHGSVCRPDWLVEIEAEAMAPAQTDFPDFC